MIPAGMFFGGLGGLLRVLIAGTIGYLWLIGVLRVTGKRTSRHSMPSTSS